MSPLGDVQRRVRDAVVMGDAASAASLFVGGKDAAQRLAIHLRQYRTSLVTAVMGRFPATGWLVGTPLLEEAATQFVREHPPSAPCIGEYGQRFPQFLVTWPGTKRVSYLGAFADLDWHLGRLAVAIDLPVVKRDDVAAVAAVDLADVALTIQPGTYYAHAEWPVDDLMKLYLSDAAPEQLILADTDVWIEVRGARGSFRFSRLTATEFSFRVAIAEGLSLGDAAQRAWDIDPTFDPGLGLLALVDSGLATRIGRNLGGLQS
ncbi:MAG: putative DNA-binding domain-containing protein [Acidobacteria bacterium]|nr:putative DNA-binding domain-containing protein [Acidobacteriota bacterium]